MTDRPDPLAAARALFAPADGLAYLDTATYGLPPVPTVTAVENALRGWRSGSADWIEDWDRPTDQCRVDFATLIGADAETIASIPAVSVGVGMIAQRLDPGDEVVVVRDEFASVLFPLLVASESGIVVRQVGLEDVAAAIGPQTRLLAFSLVQMQTGRMADLASILDAAERYDARVLVDATQAIPFVEVAAEIDRIDYLACPAYKHLLSPRGVAFLYVHRSRWSELRPINSNWRAAADPFGPAFGGPLRLGDDARRFDVSRAWHAWVGAVESMRLLTRWREQGLFDVVLERTQRLARELGQPWHGSSIVCVAVRDTAAAEAALRAARVKAAIRGPTVRLAAHVYTTNEDIDRAISALSDLASPSV